MLFTRAKTYGNQLKQKDNMCITRREFFVSNYLRNCVTLPAIKTSNVRGKVKYYSHFRFFRFIYTNVALNQYVTIPIRKLMGRWTKCIVKEGDYVENDVLV